MHEREISSFQQESDLSGAAAYQRVNNITERLHLLHPIQGFSYCSKQQGNNDKKKPTGWFMTNAKGTGCVIAIQ